MFGKKEINKTELNFRGTDKVFGTDYLFTRLATQSKDFHYKGRSTNFFTYNFLIINTKDLSKSWLFPNNDQIINNFYQVPLHSIEEIDEDYYHEVFQPFHYDNDDFSNKKLTGWLLFVFTKNQYDNQTIALSDPSGKNIVEILDKIETIYNKIRISEDELILLYKSEQLDWVSKIKLSEKKVIHTQELPTI